MFPSTFSQSDQCMECSLVSVSERSLSFLVCVCTRLRNRSQPVGRCSRHDHLLNRNESLYQQHLPEKLSPNIRPRPRARLRTRMKPQMRGLDCISDWITLVESGDLKGWPIGGTEDTGGMESWAWDGRREAERAPSRPNIILIAFAFVRMRMMSGLSFSMLQQWQWEC